MWPFILKYRVYFLAAVLALVSGVSVSLGYRLGTAEGNRQTIKALKAGEKVVAKRRAEINTLRDQSDEDAIRIAKLSHNARVRVCTQRPANRLPGDTDASAPGDDRASGEDITGLLRQCLRTFGEVTRARK